jgi:CBS domain-containing protein
MKVAELMRTNLKTVVEDATVGDAVVTMADAHVSGVPVLDTRGRLVGVLSTSDILTALAEAGEGPAQDRVLADTRVREIMTSRPVTVSPHADALEAARDMLYMDVHRVFVEDEGVLVGVISQTDIVAAVATAKI